MNPENQNKILEELRKISQELKDLRTVLFSHEERLKNLEKEKIPAIPREVREEIPPPPPPPPVVKPSEGFEWETILGGNWLVRIGIAALVFGVAFFLKWAFDHQIIGVVGRLILGLIGGTILIGVGEYFRPKYRIYSQLLTGGGIAILYLTIFAAFYIYDKISAGLAFPAMIFVSVISALLAVRGDAPSIATLGLLGAFGTPLMFLSEIFLRGASPDFLTQSVIPWYLLILNLGILGILVFKNWRQLILLGLVGTYVMYGVWFSVFSEVTGLWLQELYLFLYFLIFAKITILYNLLWKKKTIITDILLILGNAATFFIWSYLLLLPDYKEWLGFLPTLLAAFYISLGYLSLARYKEDLLLSLSLGGLGITFLVLIAPIQWDYPWVTLAWATEAVILTWIGFYLGLKEMRFAGMVVLLLAVFRLFFRDVEAPRSPLFGDSPLLFFNERFFVFFFVVFATFLAAYFYAKWREQIAQEERMLLPTLLLGGNFLFLFTLTYDLWTFFEEKVITLSREISQLYQQRDIYGPPQEKIRQIQEQLGNLKNIRNFSVSFLWMLYAIILLIIGFSKRYTPIRIFSLVLLWIVIFKVFLYDIFLIGEGWRVAAFISLGIILLISGYFYVRFSQRIKEFLFEEKT